MPGSKRSALPVRLNSPMAAAAVADVQGAVVEKGLKSWVKWLINNYR